MAKLTITGLAEWTFWNGDYRIWLDYYEQKAKVWLEKEGFAREWDPVKDFDWDWPPAHIKELVFLLMRVAAVRGLADTKPEQALWHMAMLIRSAQRAGMPDLTQEMLSQMQREHAKHPRSTPTKDVAQEVFASLRETTGADPTAKALVHAMKNRGHDVPLSTARKWRTEFAKNQH